jgi:BolA family transcriptional regulator, general stress-responsive regulator
MNALAIPTTPQAPAGARTVDRLRQLVQDALLPVELTIRDDSAAHIGHAGANTGKGHYHMRIVAKQFAGLSVIAQHRLVYKIVLPLFDTEVHALSLDTFAPNV